MSLTHSRSDSTMLPVSYLAMNILIKQIKEIHTETEILQRGDKHK